MKQQKILQYITLKNILRIVIPLMICVVVFFIWRYKSDNDNALILKGYYDNPSSPYALVTDSINYKDIFAAGQPLVVDYGKEGCPICEDMAPMLKKYNEMLKGKAYVKFVNSLEYPKDLKKMGIHYPPLQVFFTGVGAPYQPSKDAMAQIDFQYIVQRSDGEKEEIPATGADLEDLTATGSEIVYTFHRGELTEAQLIMIMTELGITLEEKDE